MAPHARWVRVRQHSDLSNRAVPHRASDSEPTQEHTRENIEVRENTRNFYVGDVTVKRGGVKDGHGSGRGMTTASKKILVIGTYWPLGHVVHAVALTAGEYVPAAQLVQGPPLGEYWPATHSQQPMPMMPQSWCPQPQNHDCTPGHQPGNAPPQHLPPRQRGLDMDRM